jgi:hypothetical protein
VLYPDQVTGPIDIKGTVSAKRANSFDYVVEWGPGVQPLDSEFKAIAPAMMNIPSTTVIGGATPLAQLDITKIDPKHLRDVDSPYGENDTTITVRVRATAHYGGAVGDVKGEMRRTYYVQKDPDLVKGFPIYLGDSGENSPKLADIDGDGVRDIVYTTAGGLLHVYKIGASGPTELPGFPFKALAEDGLLSPAPTAQTPVYLNAPAYKSGGVDGSTSNEPFVTSPAIADLDGDGTPEIILLGSVQNASQTDRLKGVGLWALHHDASRLKGWETPFHAPDYLAGLWDYDGTNVVAATNQVTVADIDPSRPGPEMIFAGFDGRIHAVGADAKELWAVTYTTDENVLTGGVVVGDLSGDGIPEIVFNTYSIDEGKGALFILDAGGNVLHQIALPHRGAMPVPTLADVDGDGTVEIVVSLKDADDKVESAEVYTVPGSSTNCLLWPTGRGNLARNGWVRPAK